MLKAFNNLSIRAKLFTGFSIMILLLGVIGLTGYRSAHQVDMGLTEIFTVNLPSLDYLIEADRDLQQLLVAERSMIFSNAKSDIFKTLVEDYETNLKQADERWEKYKALASTPEEKAIIPEFEKARKEWKDISRKVVDGRIADTRQGRREALDLTLGLAREKFEGMRDHLDKLTGVILGLAERARDQARDIYRQTSTIFFGATAFGLLVGLVLAFGINRSVAKPLGLVAGGLTEASDQVGSASDQVSEAGQQLAEGASEQAASLEETSSSLEEMASMTRQNAANAGQADALMKEANKVVGEADQSMRELTGSMTQISQASEETSKIIKTIDEIAFQTNLLALNAAVEAARAGEAGAGFAVVADEVRNLAMRAADAAKNTSTLIEGTVKRVHDGSQLLTRANEAFAGVYESSSKVAELVGEIAAASDEQAGGIEQINKAVAELDKVTQQSAANAEESASASEEMNAQARQMKSFVADLLAVVEGARRARQRTVRASRNEPVESTWRRRAPAEVQRKGNGKELPTANNMEVSPEQVIPFEEEDFSQF